MKILVTGRSGQLASALAAASPHFPTLHLYAVGRPEMDLMRPDAAAKLIEDARPDLVINAAAYTAVDRAEADPELAHAVNCAGAAALAQAAGRLAVPFVQISTDYVFDGCKGQAYDEEDSPHPLNVYGQSKLRGENAVLESGAQAFVLRTSWIYSAYGNNFLRTMLRLGRERPQLRIVMDQIGNPTSAVDLATAILTIAPALKTAPGGIFHLAGTGATNWYELAKQIFAESSKYGGTCPGLEGISTSTYGAAAARPADSRLACHKFESCFGLTLPHWHDSIARDVARCFSLDV